MADALVRWNAFTLQSDIDESGPVSKMSNPLHKAICFRIAHAPAFLMSAVLVLALGMALYWLMHAERIRFQASIREGMSVHDVIATVGDPAQIIEPGATIPKWGNAMPKVAAFETWIYYVTPKSQHRFLLTFRDGRLARCERQQN